MRFRFLPIALAAFAALLASPLCPAAQNAKINSAGAEIHSFPDANSAVIGSLNGGDIVRVSSRQKDGWYRVLVNQPAEPARALGPAAAPSAGQLEFGWVAADAVEPLGEMQEFREVGVQYTPTVDAESNRHHWVILGIFDGLAIQPSTMTTNAPSSKMFMSMEYGLELGYRLSTLWTLSIHGSLHQFSHSFNSDGASGSYVEAGKDLGAIIEYTYVHKLPWKLGIALGGGTSPGTRLAVTTGETTVDSTPFTSWLAIGKITARAYFANHFALEVETGYRYLSKTKVSFGSTSADIFLGAPFAGAGMQLEF